MNNLGQKQHICFVNCLIILYTIFFCANFVYGQNEELTGTVSPEKQVNDLSVDPELITKNNEIKAVKIRDDDGIVAWYEPADDGSGTYTYSNKLNEALTDADNISTFVLGLFIFGLIGQLIFMGRFVLQWIVSEWYKRSVVPVGFWWLSLVGASMLLIYFIIRHEPVGILGQALGWPVYARNLWLISRTNKREQAQSE